MNATSGFPRILKSAKIGKYFRLTNSQGHLVVGLVGLVGLGLTLTVTIIIRMMVYTRPAVCIAILVLLTIRPAGLTYAVAPEAFQKWKVQSAGK